MEEPHAAPLDHASSMAHGARLPRLQTINHWALIYCALTGESLAEGGKHVMQLFVVSRWWAAVVSAPCLPRIVQ
jgi:hypothetical protein